MQRIDSFDFIFQATMQVSETMASKHLSGLRVWLAVHPDLSASSRPPSQTSPFMPLVGKGMEGCYY